MKTFFTLIILCISLNGFSLSFESISHKTPLKIEVAMRTINQHTIIDPVAKISKVQIGSKTYTFKNKDLFFKQTPKKKMIFGRTGKYFVHITSKKLNERHSKITLNLRNRVSKKTKSYKAVFQKSHIKSKSKVVKISYSPR